MENPDGINNKNVSLSLIGEYGASDSDSDDTDTQNRVNDDSDSPELSDMVLKNNMINACAHGPWRRNSNVDDEEPTRHMIIDNMESGVVEYEVTEYRDIDSDSDSSSSSDSCSDVDSVKDVEEISSGDEHQSEKAEKHEPPKVRGELGLDDLPPIEDLAISLPEHEATKIGVIASVVDRLVIVRAFPDTPAVDLDSVLFLDNGAKTLGRVFDVFGPVREPHYCVRFNSAQHVAERGVEPGASVFIAPPGPHTAYVFIAQLIKMKGSDASWLHDIEPPPSQIEYSDDEEERRAKKEKQASRQESSENGETSKNPNKKTEKKNPRPSDSSSRFGSGPSRGRNPFTAGSRRSSSNSFPRLSRPWSHNMEVRTPPPHPIDHPPFSAPPFMQNGPPNFPPFNPRTPPFMGNSFRFGGHTRMRGQPMGMPPSFRHRVPVFGSNYCNMAGPQPKWTNGQPSPPGT